MKTIILILSLILVVFVATLNATTPLKMEPDGMNCAVCSALVIEAERLIEQNHGSVVKGLEKACKIFPGQVSKICKSVVDGFGDKIIGFVKEKLDADQICNKLGMCDQCHVYVDDKKMKSAYYGGEIKLTTAQVRAQHQLRQLAAVFGAQFKTIRDKFRRPPTKDVSLDPSRLFDWDGDGFSALASVKRGAHWKGADCNDLDRHTHPGIVEQDTMFDKNCNGIKGRKNWIKGPTYEDEYCNSYANDRQIFFFGDSASAGFSINAEWLDLKNMTDLLKGLVHEMAWPQEAFTSGSTKYTDESLRIEFEKHNRCAKNQFQNVAYSGAIMSDFPNQVKYLHITQDDKTKPALVFIGYIGNDVCEPTLEDMTSPADFKAALVKGLALLDEKLPSNSRVVVFTLVDGEILFDMMHDQIHPLSTKDHPITYERFYDFLTCTGMNPCTTWLTSNQTLREETSKHARILDDVIHDVIAQNEYKHFKAASFSFTQLIDEGFKELEKRGHAPSELVNKIDGFHPSLNVGHPIIARAMWDHLLHEWGDDFLGEPNPNNEYLIKKFGA